MSNEKESEQFLAKESLLAELVTDSRQLAITSRKLSSQTRGDSRRRLTRREMEEEARQKNETARRLFLHATIRRGSSDMLKIFLRFYTKDR